MSLSPTQVKALDLLQAAGGRLDYEPRLFGFAKPDAVRGDSVPMVTAKALISAGLVNVTRTKLLRGKDVPDQLELVSASVDQKPDPVCNYCGGDGYHAVPRTPGVDCEACKGAGKGRSA